MHSHYTVTRFFVQANILLFLYSLVFKMLEFCGNLLNYSSSHIAQHGTIENLSVCVFVSLLISWLCSSSFKGRNLILYMLIGFLGEHFSNI